MSTVTTAVQEARPVPHPPHGAGAIPGHAAPSRSAAPRLRPSRVPAARSAATSPLTVGQPGDHHEREAQSVADTVMRMPDPARSAAPRVAPAGGTTSIVQDALQSPGRPLDTATRSFMEPRFGYDFSGVRVHSGEQAAESARNVKALAYAVGPDVVFGAGQYAPDSMSGRRLLAHELQHVVQNDTCRISRQAAGGGTDAGTGGPSPAADPAGKQKADAHQAVDAFRKSAGGPAWPNLTLSVIADELDERIDTPALISQSVLNACGPAAIAYMLASNNPVRFVQIVQELFGTGKASLDGEVLAASPKLRQNTPPVNMAQVDWMLMSSMRDSQNAIFSYKGNASEDFSAITTPHDLTHWMRSILKCDNVTWRSAYVSGELAILRAAGIAASSGKSVALLIDAAMLDNKKKDGKVGIPDHWVVLKSSVVEVAEGDKVQFSVWTWGERAGRNLDLDKSVVLKTFYGAAICSP